MTKFEFFLTLALLIAIITTHFTVNMYYKEKEDEERYLNSKTLKSST